MSFPYIVLYSQRIRYMIHVLPSSAILSPLLESANLYNYRPFGKGLESTKAPFYSSDCIGIQCQEVLYLCYDQQCIPVFRSCIILRNSVVAGNRTEAPAWIYIYSGGVWKGFGSGFISLLPIPKGVIIWQMTVGTYMIQASVDGVSRTESRMVLFSGPDSTKIKHQIPPALDFAYGRVRKSSRRDEAPSHTVSQSRQSIDWGGWSPHLELPASRLTGEGGRLIWSCPPVN